jgi:phosphoglycolate phosphatase
MKNSNKINLILFDIDSTILKNSINGKLVFYHGINNVLNKKIDLKSVQMTGLCDKQIITEYLIKLKISKTEISKLIKPIEKEMVAFYLSNLLNEKKIKLLPGVKKLIESISEMDYPIGLATGNLEKIAYAKMNIVGLKKYFNFGGFGDSNISRKNIIIDAIKNAKKQGKKFNNVFHIGDSIFDVIGGRLAGVETIAVCTGTTSVKELKKQNPTYLLNNLSDTRKIISIIK